MTRRCFLSFATCFLVLASSISNVPGAAGGQRTKRTPTPASDKLDTLRGSGQVTLTNGTGDRSLTVNVDGYGAFGSETGSGGAVFDPTGPIGPSTTTYASAIFFSPAQDFLASSGLATRPPPTFSSTTTSSATSSFTVGNCFVELTQTVRRTENGSTLTQTYQIRNLGTSTRTFSIVRFLDGDLQFDGSLSDFGAASEDGRTLSEFDAGDDPESASTYVGITDSGGAPYGYTIQQYPYDGIILESQGIPASDDGVILNDNNGDRVTDIGYDVTLSLASVFMAASNETVTYTTTTRFGDQTLVPRATLSWDPPDASSTLEEPPPQHLVSIPIGTGAATDAVLEPPMTTRVARADVTSYNVYSSSSSPVVPSADTFFTSVPATTTTAAVPTSAGGSFFVVSANYPTGESDPSNEASADVPAATLTTVKVKPTKINAKGADFTSVVSVFLDGIPFLLPAKVKGTTKVNQKGNLITGQSISAYIASRGGTVLITFRNSNGGVVARRHTQ